MEDAVVVETSKIEANWQLSEEAKNYLSLLNSIGKRRRKEQSKFLKAKLAEISAEIAEDLEEEADNYGD